jgi:hypothetical protein
VKRHASTASPAGPSAWAGHLGFNATGKSIILADNPLQRRELFTRYVCGLPEPIASSFNSQDQRTWIIRLLSQVRAVREAEGQEEN